MDEKPTLDYSQYISDAMRQVVRRSLTFVQQNGFYDNHHFYISFLTTAPNVHIPEFLVEEYPEEMTIVLQHQFFNLKIDEDKFSVDLSFRKKFHKLIIPFGAITNFADPHVNMVLRFLQKEKSKVKSLPSLDLPENSVKLKKRPRVKSEFAPEFVQKTHKEEAKPAETKIVSIAQFRKKDDG